VRREMSAEEIAARQQTLDVLVDARVAVLNQDATYRRQDAQWELEPLGALAELWADQNHPRAAALLCQLGRWWSRLGVWSRAETFLRRALAIAQARDGADSPYVEMCLLILSLEVLRPTGRLAEAESLLRRVVGICDNAHESRQRTIGVVLGQIAEIAEATGRFAEAEALLRRALAIDEKFRGSEHLSVARALRRLAELLSAMGRVAEAEPLLRRAQVISSQSRGEEDA
jgi:tetratricopeptide (TPR) repeat protein